MFIGTNIQRYLFLVSPFSVNPNSLCEINKTSLLAFASITRFRCNRLIARASLLAQTLDHRQKKITHFLCAYTMTRTDTLTRKPKFPTITVERNRQFWYTKINQFVTNLAVQSPFGSIPSRERRLARPG